MHCGCRCWDNHCESFRGVELLSRKGVGPCVQVRKISAALFRMCGIVAQSSEARRRLVERIDAVAAVERQQPQGVLCCWQPFRIDWTAAFRSCPSVIECGPSPATDLALLDGGSLARSWTPGRIRMFCWRSSVCQV